MTLDANSLDTPTYAPSTIIPRAGGGKEHLINHNAINREYIRTDTRVRIDGYTYCGLRANTDTWKFLNHNGRWGDTETYASNARLCGNCRRTYLIMLHQPTQHADEGRVVRAEQVKSQIRRAGGVVEIPARVFRVKGTKDTYTVTIVAREGMRDACTCRDNKINPDTLCKHIIAVYGMVNADGGEG